MDQVKPNVLNHFKAFSLVEFPGYLKDQNDPSKAIAALGGEDAIRISMTMPISDKVPPLSLNLRPAVNSSNSNIVAEKTKNVSNLFLLQVTEHSNTENQPKHSTTQNHNQPLEGTITGRITTITSFRSIADFQYHIRPSLDQLANSSTIRRRRPTKAHKLTQLELAGESVLQMLHRTHNQPVLQSAQIDRLRPIRFARTTVEYGKADYNFRQFGTDTDNFNGSKSSFPCPPRMLGLDGRSDANRLGALYHRVSIDVETVPDGPHPSFQPPVVRGRDVFDRLYDIVARKFEERPIWIRRALAEFIPPELMKSFKRVICMLAYCFHGTGPFFQAWIRYGFDPRKDPACRKFQVLEVRCNNPVILTAAAVVKAPGEVRVEGSGNLLSRLPLQKNNFVQICDMILEEVGEFCEADVVGPFDKRYGFFTKSSFRRLNAIIKTTLLNKSIELVGKEKSEKLLREFKVSSSYGLKGRSRRVHLKDVMKHGSTVEVEGEKEVSPEKKDDGILRISFNDNGEEEVEGVEKGAVDTPKPVMEKFADKEELIARVTEVEDAVEDTREGCDDSNDEDDSGMVDIGGVEGFHIFGDDEEDDEDEEMTF